MKNNAKFRLHSKVFCLLFMILTLTSLLGLFTNVGQAVYIDEPTKNDNYQYLQVSKISNEGIEIEFTPPKPELDKNFIDGHTCQSITISGLTNPDSKDDLPLPYQGALLGIPVDAKPRIQIISTESTILKNTFPICPLTQQNNEYKPDGSIQKSENVYIDRFEEDENLYLPIDLVQVGSSGYIRDQHFVQIQLSALQYNPETRDLRFYNRIQLRIDFNNSYDLARRPEEFTADTYFEDNLESLLLNYEQAKAWRKPSAIELNMNSSDRILEEAYKILIDQNGIYQISYSDLQDAGLPIDLINPSTIQIFNQGNEVAINFEGDDDSNFEIGESVLFYGQKPDSKYTKVNTYWLTWSSDGIGLRMTEIDGTPPSPTETGNTPTNFETNLHLEENNLYVSYISSGVDQEHWFWNLIGSDSAFDITFNLPHLSDEEHNLIVSGLLESFTSSTNPPVKIYINNETEPIFNGNLSGGLQNSFSAEINQSILQKVGNFIRIEIIEDSDLVSLNWYELSYFDTYFAENDKLYFDGDESGTWFFKVDGFSNANIETLDITEPNAPAIIRNAETAITENGQQLLFQATIAEEHHYYAQTTAQRLSPLGITYDTPSNLKTSTNGADYIIISHADFLEEALEGNDVWDLAQFRESQGFRVEVIDVQDIYDEFSNGLLDPDAIRSFLSFAYENWEKPSPSYVLLIGDGSYDFKDFKETGEMNFIPPYLEDVDGTLGETATDNRYVCVSGDDILPDMYLGRFPVKTFSEAQIMVEKTLFYEQSPPVNDWNTKLTFLADNAEPGNEFVEHSDTAITYVPETYTSEKIYYDVDYSKAEARTALQDAVNEGRLIVQYNGHGAMQYWAGEKLLQLSDLSLFSNADKLAFLMPMTCMEGYFIWPGAQSVGGSIVRLENGGAVASWSPTGYGFAIGHVMLSSNFLNNLFNNFHNQIGYLTTQAKYELFTQTSNFRDLIDTFVLFGDPALRLKTIPVQLEAPSNLVATASSNHQIDLSWTDNSVNETAFLIERSPNGTGDWEQIADVGPNQTTYSDIGLQVSSTYHYRVRAYRIGDGTYSEYSNEDDATIESLLFFYLPLIVNSTP